MRIKLVSADGLTKFVETSERTDVYLTAICKRLQMGWSVDELCEPMYPTITQRTYRYEGEYEISEDCNLIKIFKEQVE